MASPMPFMLIRQASNKSELAPPIPQFKLNLIGNGIANVLYKMWWTCENTSNWETGTQLNENISNGFLSAVAFSHPQRSAFSVQPYFNQYIRTMCLFPVWFTLWKRLVFALSCFCCNKIKTEKWRTHERRQQCHLDDVRHFHYITMLALCSTMCTLTIICNNDDHYSQRMQRIHCTVHICILRWTHVVDIFSKETTKRNSAWQNAIVIMKSCRDVKREIDDNAYRSIKCMQVHAKWNGMESRTWRAFTFYSPVNMNTDSQSRALRKSNNNISLKAALPFGDFLYLSLGLSVHCFVLRRKRDSESQRNEEKESEREFERI